MQRKTFAYALFAAATAIPLAIHWGRLGNLHVDIFRDMHVITRLMDGAALYRDITYPYGFLPAHLYAFLFRFFGATLPVTIGLNTIVLAVVTLAGYRLARTCADRLSAIIITATFMLLCGINTTNIFTMFNFLLPYSIASAHFTAAVMLTLWMTVKAVETNKIGYTWAAIIAGVLSAGARPESAATVFAAMLLTAGLLKNARIAFIAFVAALSSIAMYAVFLSTTGAWNGFIESTYTLSLAQKTNPHSFFAAISGFDNLKESIPLLLQSTLTAIAAFGIPFAVLLIPTKSARITIAVSVAALTCASIAAGCILAPQSTDIIRFLPVFCVLGMFTAAYAPIRGISDKERLTICLLCACGIAMLSRIALRTIIGHYAFYLAVPALFALGMSLVVLSRTLTGNKQMVFRACAAIIAGSVCLFFLRFEATILAKKTYPVSSPKGTITTHHPVYSQRITAAYDWVRTHVGAEEELLSIPELQSVYFFTGRDNTFRYDAFTPAQLGVYTETKLCADIETRRTPYVLIHSRDYHEYGADVFGIDPGKTILEYLNKNYDRVFATDGDLLSQTDFAIWIFRRKMPEPRQQRT